MKHMTEAAPLLPETLPNGDSPSGELRELYQRMVAKERESRPVSTSHVRQALKAMVRGTPIQMSEMLMDPGFSTEGTDAGVVIQGASEHTTLKSEVGKDLARTEGETLPKNDLARTTTDALDASVILPKPEQSKWIWAVILLLVLGGAASMFLMDRNPQQPASAMEVGPDQATATETIGASAQVNSEEPVPEPKQPEMVTSYRFTLTTSPAGAEIFDGEEAIGASPKVVGIPQGEVDRVLTIKLKGHESQDVLVNRNTPSPLQIQLKRIAKPTRKAKRSRKRSVKPSKQSKQKLKTTKPKVEMW